MASILLSQLVPSAFAQNTAGSPTSSPSQQAADPPSGRDSATAKSDLRVASDKPPYTHGDVMTLTVDIPHDKHLRIYGVSVDGSTVLLFPNKWVQNDKVAKGSLVLPAKDSSYDFLLVLDENQTHVTESVHAVFSLEPFTDPGKDGIEFGTAKFQ